MLWFEAILNLFRTPLKNENDENDENCENCENCENDPLQDVIHKMEHTFQEGLDSLNNLLIQTNQNILRSSDSKSFNPFSE